MGYADLYIGSEQVASPFLWDDARRVSLLGRGYASQQRPMLCTAETTGFSGTSTTRFRMPFEICSQRAATGRRGCAR